MKPASRFALIIPCFNFERGLPETFEKLAHWHKTDGAGAVVHFVDDGSTDATSQLIAEFVERNRDWARSLRLSRNQGKGAALRAGFASALKEAENSGLDLAVFTDCDLHYGLKIITARVIPALESGEELVVADRSWSLSAVHQTLSRKLASGVFNRAMSVLTGVAFRDSQAGLKGFRLSRVRPIFDILTMKGFTLDVELLSIALYYRLRVRQIPVSFATTHEFPVASTVQILRASLHMLLDLVRINLNWKRGRYQSLELQNHVDRELYRIESE